MSSHRFVRREQRQAEAEPGQVKRYWPGRAPDWYKEDKDEEVEEQSEDEAGPAAFGKLAVEDGPAFGAVAAPSIVKKVSQESTCIARSSHCTPTAQQSITSIAALSSVPTQSAHKLSTAGQAVHLQASRSPPGRSMLCLPQLQLHSPPYAQCMHPDTRTTRGVQADPRLQRLQQAQKAGSDEPRQIAVAQVVSRRRHGTPSDSEEEAGSGADRDGADSDDEDGPEAPARAESDPEEDADALARRAALRAR